MNDRVQRLCVHHHGESVAWRSADLDHAGAALAAALSFHLRLLLGPIGCQGPLLEVLADRICISAVEKRAVLDHGEGEFFQDIAAVEVVEAIFHLEAQASDKLGPVDIIGVGGAVNDKTPGSVAVVLELPLDKIGGVVVP